MTLLYIGSIYVCYPTHFFLWPSKSCLEGNAAPKLKKILHQRLMYKLSVSITL